MTRIETVDFGLTKNGRSVKKYIMKNHSGMTVCILDYGCTVQSILVPDRNGNLTDVVLGYDDLLSYEKGSCYFGAFIGRYANRIKNAEFRLNGAYYYLEPNDGRNHLHGGFCRKVFDAAVEGDTLVFKYISPHMEEGFPGELNVEVRYQLTEDNALEMEYIAGTDRDTVLNLTNHSYFNLSGSGDVTHHLLWLDSDRITESDSETVPTGRIISIKNTPMDFSSEKPIGADILDSHPQIRPCRGYDHNYILKESSDDLLLFATVKSAKSGIALTCFTTQPAVQLYSGNYVDEDTADRGKGGVRYPRYAGVCLETQHYPASPNYPCFPSAVLRPDEEYRHKTVYQFSIF